MCVNVLVISESFLRGFSVQAYGETPRKQWVKEWPGQVVLCTSQIFWTLEVHEAISGGKEVRRGEAHTVQSL